MIMPVAMSQDGLSGGGGDLQPPWSRTSWWCVQYKGMVCVPVGSILGWQSLKPLVTSQGSSAVQCPGMLQQRMLTK